MAMETLLWYWVIKSNMFYVVLCMAEREVDITGTKTVLNCNTVHTQLTSVSIEYMLYRRYMWHWGNTHTIVQCLSNQNVTNNAAHYWPLGKNHWSSCMYWCCSLFMMRHRLAGKHLNLCGGPNKWAHVNTEWNSAPNGRSNPVLHDIF